ncbi:MAG TPA: glycosyltransferase family A protein [Candidatus Bathyarchaeia archaeon]
MATSDMNFLQDGGRIESGAGKNSPTVSVVIPTWNSMSNNKCVERTLHSVISQGVDAEVVVVDNFSKDSTRAVCELLGARVYQKSTSRSDARNFGLEVTHGDFVLFLDSDHELEPGALTEALHRATEQELDAVFLKTTFLQIDSNSRVSNSPLELELRLRGGVRFPNLIRRSSMQQIRFRADLDLGEDHVFMESLLGRGARIGSMDWGLRHYSKAGLAPVWERSVQYGRAYRRNHDLPNKSKFQSELGVWNSTGIRAYYTLLQSSPWEAFTLAWFLVVKYVGFAFGYIVPRREASRDVRS